MLNVRKLRLLPQDIFVSDHLGHDLAGKTVRGGMAMLGAQSGTAALSMARTVILARLLTPSDFGVVGMVAVFVNFVAMFKDAGLSMATIQRDGITESQISALFWINAIISTSLAIIAILSAPLVSFVYGRGELTAVTIALSLSIPLQGLVLQHHALMRRHMRFASLGVERIGSQIAALVAAVLLALGGARYWALVGSVLVSGATGIILTFAMCPWIPGSLRRGTGAKDMVKFGINIAGFDFINYFARHTDNLLIGKYLGAQSLGYYTKAYSLFMLPTNQIRLPLTSIALPAMSALKKQADRYVRYYARLIELMATLVVPISVYCAIEGEFIVSFLLGTQWEPAIPVFRILAIAGLVDAVAGTRGLVILSSGYAGRYFRWGVINAVTAVAAFIVGIRFGTVGVAASYAISRILLLLPSLYYCFYRTPVRVSVFFHAMAWPWLHCALCGTGLYALQQWALPSMGHSRHILFGLVYWSAYAILAWSRPSIRLALSLAAGNIPWLRKSTERSVSPCE